MKRKILRFAGEDIIPYVDGYGVEIGGTNLVDYLDQIESTFAKSLLFLGAFATETALLTAYPNGSDLEVGTYAIVSDTDTLYIYDTDNSEWLPTASNISGIMELNGLTPVSGALTITGGDINSTVSSAEVPTQTITAHLNNLYQENDTQNSSISGLFSKPIGTFYASTSNIVDSDVVYSGTISSGYLGKQYAIAQFSKNSSATGSEYVKLILTDGTTNKTYSLRNAKNNNQFKYKELYAKLGFNQNTSTSGLCLMAFDNTNNYAFILDFERKPTQQFRTFSINNGAYDWQTGTSGYYQSFDLKEIQIKPNYRVVSVSKNNNGVLTTAIVDYRIIAGSSGSADMLRIYSDEKFEGSITVMYDYE